MSIKEGDKISCIIHDSFLKENIKIDFLSKTLRSHILIIYYFNNNGKEDREENQWFAAIGGFNEVNNIKETEELKAIYTLLYGFLEDEEYYKLIHSEFSFEKLMNRLNNHNCIIKSNIFGISHISVYDTVTMNLVNK
jgi:hypothetical protein